MKPNITSVKKFLPEEIKFNKYDLSRVCYTLRKKGILSLTREEHSELIANEYLIILEQEKTKKIQDKIDYKKVSNLYKICIPFKIDCYSASARFIEYKYSEFIECPDRKPSNPLYKEEDGYFYNHIMKKTGYFKKCCANLMKELNICNHQLHIVENHIEEFKKFIYDHNKVLKKHVRNNYIDYSHLAYNGVTDDF